ncbi:hypothetical protein H0H93_002296 [Arthromyces matolae]|nr:hypothetical protein H0H93_002296 [Arthromyces matolae]
MSTTNSNRYQDLGLGHRVPLHRRGTSKTYERLEDLLKEAGYKETRVFTPEADRVQPKHDTGNAGAFVGFISGLIPNRSTSSLVSISPSPSRSSLSQRSLILSSTHHLPKSTQNIRPNSPSPISGPSYQHIAQQSHHSRAGAYLRHIASAPNMKKKRPPTKSMLTDDSESDSQTTKNHIPPLPDSWIKSVARAVLVGGIGAYIGGPNNDDPSPTPTNKTLRPTRSSLSQASAHPKSSKRTNTDYTRKPSFAPPELFTRIERGRSRLSTGEVRKSSVVCRSAPASRASSLVRGLNEDPREKRDWERQQGTNTRAARRGRPTERDRQLPSLANTQLEGDKWLKPKKSSNIKGKGKGTEAKSRYLAGWGMDPESSEDSGEGRISSSEEEDGELNLARILVNPKRQNSIVSLRKHLKDENAVVGMSGTRPGRGLGRASRAASIRQNNVEEQDYDGSEAEDWGAGWVRKNARRTSEHDDEDDNFVGFLVDRTRKGGKTVGSGRSGTGSSRLGIPGAWNIVNGGS